jgi:hypothetical protein
LTIGRLANIFLASKQRLVDSGELEKRTWSDYHSICARVLRVLGPGRRVADLRPADFELLRGDFAKTHGPVALHSDVTGGDGLRASLAVWRVKHERARV